LITQGTWNTRTSPAGRRFSAIAKYGTMERGGLLWSAGFLDRLLVLNTSGGFT